MTREPNHPGETLREDLDALGMSAAELARRIEVPMNCITEILNGRRAVTGDTALRLGYFFGTSGEFWLNLQKLSELRRAEQKNGAAIARLVSLDDNERLWASRGKAPPALHGRGGHGGPHVHRLGTPCSQSARCVAGVLTIVLEGILCPKRNQIHTCLSS